MLEVNECERIASKVISALPDLSKDTFQYVRIALAENILSLAPVLGKSKTNEHILPIFLQLLRDESSEVRIALFD